MSNTNIKNWILALALAAAAPTAVYAAPAGSNPPAAAPEEGRCTGHVYDADGEDVIGATVIVDGTKNATATDLDGNFSLNNVRPGAKITVTYVGMKAWHGTWNGQPLDIQLSTDSSVLDEVVVMGYGVEQKRAKVTNSIAKVGEKTLTIGTNANPAQALAGAVSGVKVGITTGAPGATPNITIRGGSNYSDSNNGAILNSSYNSPLIVVDGQVRGSLADINPNDIESMEVLKDAGATALYGARAGNGVIIVTTKKGKEGTGKVNFNMKWGLGYYDNGYETISGEEYLNRYRTACFNSEHMRPGGAYAANYNSILWSNNQPGGIGRTEWANNMTYNILQKNEKTEYLLNQGWSQMLDPVSDTHILYWDQDIMKLNTNQPSLTQDYNVSFSGGNDRGKYYASLGYYNAEGTIKHTSYKRYNFALTGEYKLTNWLTSNSIFNFTRSENKTQPFGMRSGSDIVGYMLNRGFMYKFVRYYDEEGNNLVGTGANQPTTNINTFNGLEDYNPSNDKFQMTQALTVNIIDNLKLKGTMSWLYNESYEQYSQKAFPTNNTGAANMEGTAGVNRTYAQGASFQRYFDQTYNLVASWNKTFAEAHTVSAMAGMEYYRRAYKYFDADTYGAPTDFYNLALGTQDSRTMSSSNLDEALLSYFGRVEYDYMDKYLFAATFREDGYSRLINKRWGFFPGVSAGWVFSKEKFWEDNADLKWFNYGKLRASYGMNATINSSYLGYYTLQGAYSNVQYDGTVGYRLTTLPNPDLSWEKTRTAEVGLTMGFLQNRFNLDVTYYNRTTMDKYANKTLPPTSGFSSIMSNNGSYRNEGVEFDINATILRMRDFQWTLGANLTFNHNKIVELPVSGLDNNRVSGTGTEVYTGAKNAKGEYIQNEDGTYPTHFVGGFQEGQSPFQVAGYGVVKMARTQADVDALGDYIDIGGSYGVAVYATEKGRQRLVEMGYRANQMVQMMPGDLIFEDRNGDNKIEALDRKIIGERDVKWSGGFNTTLTWKGLSLYARFDYGFGFQVYDSNLAFWLGEGQGAMSFPTQIRDTWTTDNPTAKYPRVVWASQYGTDNYIRTSEFFKQNGSYIACRELSLSYQLPEKICHKFRCQGLAVSVTGQNLGYIKSCTIPLPDYVSYWNGNTAGWGGTYNLPRTLIFGLNVSF